MSKEDSAATKANDLVYGDRFETYGHPAEVYEPVARLWGAYLQRYIRPEDVAMMMALFKIGREMTRHNEDNVTDTIGYMLVLERILEYNGSQDIPKQAPLVAGPQLPESKDV